GKDRHYPSPSGRGAGVRGTQQRRAPSRVHPTALVSLDHVDRYTSRMTEFIPPGTHFLDLPSPFAVNRGGELHGGRMAYETWGTLNGARELAVLIMTGLSPDAHAAASQANPGVGWWEAMLGPGKPIDSNRWFVVCVNTLGSCKGSSGPASIDP